MVGLSLRTYPRAIRKTHHSMFHTRREREREIGRERERESGIGDVGLRSFGLLVPNNLEPSPAWHPCKWFIYQLFFGCHLRFLPSLGTLEVTVL
jgi:hypothetical protein